MTTLYLDRSGTILEALGEVIALRDATGRLERRIPIKFLERVVIRARCYLDSSTLASLAANDVPVLILDGRAGRRLAHWVGAPHNDARRRWGQLLTLAEPTSAATLARAFVHAKIRRQRRTLVAIGSARPDLRKPLWDACQTLQSLERRLRDDPGLPLDTLRGCEGAAAAAYFPAFFHAFPARIRPSARNRRPPRDPVNAALSLGYTLLYGLAVNACWSAGLDPAIGALHAPAHGRAALACDLVEPLRGQIDEWTWQLFRRELLRPEHFGVEGSGACLLGKAGRAVFWREWEWRSRRWQRLLDAILATYRQVTARIDATEAEALVRQRRGQALFRQALCDYWGGRCAISGLDVPELLRASHAKPWKDATDAERLDVHNGLLLVAHLDAAYDQGLITVHPDGRVEPSRRLPPAALAVLGLTEPRRVHGLVAAHAPFLAWHVTHVFIAG